MPRAHAEPQVPVRAFWSGTITFGLVSIPVDFFAAARGRRTAMRMVDARGHALSREYHSGEHDAALESDDLVRGYETQKGEMVVVTAADLEAIAPEMTRDIELRVFVAKDEIPPAYFVRPYFLAPSGRSQKAYQLLARVMAKTGRAGVGTFVMRGRQHLVAIIADGAVLRAEILRFAAELRSPRRAGLPEPARPAPKDVRRFARAVAALKRDAVDRDELADRTAAAIDALMAGKVKKDEDVVRFYPARAGEAGEEGEGKVVDLMQVLKKSIGARAKGPASRRPHKGRRRGHTHAA